MLRNIIITVQQWSCFRVKRDTATCMACIRKWTNPLSSYKYNYHKTLNFNKEYKYCKNAIASILSQIEKSYDKGGSLNFQ